MSFQTCINHILWNKLFFLNIFFCVPQNNSFQFWVNYAFKDSINWGKLIFFFFALGHSPFSLCFKDAVEINNVTNEHDIQ